MLHLRAATADDVGLVLRFIVELAEYERLAHEVVATEEALVRTLFGAAPAAEVVIAAWDGLPVGFALFFPSYSTFLAQRGLYLEDLYVRPSHRGRGIGQALLRHLAAIAVERGYGRFEWSVLDWNEPAIRFYRALGAVPLDDWTRFRVTGDALAALAAR
ncbi:MAG TPA: GNAT family N-acetyltransferase [Kofleriaceae bacterium]|nr:GNAT family N-acetyltransferase [Kofleriaceae bacterium]